MTALDMIGEIESHIEAVQELTQQLVDLSVYPDRQDEFNRIDTARLATQEKLNSLVKGFTYYLRYGLKVESIERGMKNDATGKAG